MRLGVTLRNMGPRSTAAIQRAGARAAEAHGFESLWITDHIAIPPDDPATERVAAYRALGIERPVCALRCTTLDEYLAQLDALAALRTRIGVDTP